jgi:hypothetical protein
MPQLSPTLRLCTVDPNLLLAHRVFRLRVGRMWPWVPGLAALARDDICAGGHFRAQRPSVIPASRRSRAPHGRAGRSSRAVHSIRSRARAGTQNHVRQPASPHGPLGRGRGERGAVRALEPFRFKSNRGHSPSAFPEAALRRGCPGSFPLNASCVPTSLTGKAPARALARASGDAKGEVRKTLERRDGDAEGRPAFRAVPTMPPAGLLTTASHRREHDRHGGRSIPPSPPWNGCDHPKRRCRSPCPPWRR